MCLLGSESWPLLLCLMNHKNSLCPLSSSPLISGALEITGFGSYLPHSWNCIPSQGTWPLIGSCSWHVIQPYWDPLTFLLKPRVVGHSFPPGFISTSVSTLPAAAQGGWALFPTWLLADLRQTAYAWDVSCLIHMYERCMWMRCPHVCDSDCLKCFKCMFWMPEFYVFCMCVLLIGYV